MCRDDGLPSNDCASAALESNELNCPCWSWSQNKQRQYKTQQIAHECSLRIPFRLSQTTPMPIRAQLKSLGPTLLTQAEDIWGTYFGPGIWSQSTCILDGFLAFSSALESANLKYWTIQQYWTCKHVSTLATAWHSFTMIRALALKCLWGSTYRRYNAANALPSIHSSGEGKQNPECLIYTCKEFKL